jgi:CSLREA domain-containing protein
MFPYSRKWIILTVCACFILVILPTSQARAADPIVFSVDSTDDITDYAPGNSVCSANEITGGPCTLRAAIYEAYLNVPYSDVIINLDADTYRLTIPPSMPNNINSGDLDIPNSSSIYTITINTNDPNNRAVIDADGLDRVLRIGEGVRIKLENIIIRGGLLSLSDESPEGAGILNRGKLELHNVIIEDNQARCAQEPCPYVAGGGILNDGEVIMTSSTIHNNTSPDGSAIFNSSLGRFVILNSAIAHNQAINNWTIINNGYMHFRNATVSNNTANSFIGLINHGDLVVESSTFANAGKRASITNTSSGTVWIEDTILVALPALSTYNCDNGGNWNSNGYNIFSDSTCLGSAGGDLVNTDPKLGPLGHWGGPTMTRPLQAGSPAHNHRPTACTTIPYLPTIPPEDLPFDQRYVDRIDGKCDTGAFEGTAEIPKLFLPLVLK